MSPEVQKTTPKFGAYTLRSKLGEGGLGSVYLAEDSEGNQYALKTLKNQAVNQHRMQERFQREMRIALQLKHRNIVSTKDAGIGPGGIMFILMEYCPGGNLSRQLRKKGPISIAQAMQWLNEMAEALDYAYLTHSIIHRDIKPSNIMLDDQECSKLVDFGLARRTEDNATQLTMDGTVLGSALYMSPEQACGEKTLDVRTDLYSLGATFYHLLAGVPMFASKEVVEILVKQVNEDPPRLDTVRRDVPKGLSALIHKLLTKDPDRRVQTPNGLQQWLRELEQPAPPSMPQPSRVPPPPPLPPPLPASAAPKPQAPQARVIKRGKTAPIPDAAPSASAERHKRSARIEPPAVKSIPSAADLPAAEDMVYELTLIDTKILRKRAASAQARLSKT
jgi:eukaryotic-like serine/threonine-protein kinase